MTAPARSDFDTALFLRSLNAAAQARGTTLRDVAAKQGVGVGVISRLQQGFRPDVASLAALCAWGGFNPADFDAKAAAPAPAPTFSARTLGEAISALVSARVAGDACAALAQEQTIAQQLADLEKQLNRGPVRLR